MAEISSVILKIRRGIKDYNADPTDNIYSDEYYVDAIDASVSRYNTDVGTSYTIATLPLDLVWVIVLLGRIYMCEIRAIEDNNEDGSPGAPIRTEVPGLEIWHQPQREASANDWIKLCKFLTDQYESYLDDIGATNLTAVLVSSSVRQNLRRGRAIKRYELDEALEAISDLAVALEDTDIVVSWTALSSTQFSRYILQRVVTGADFEDNEDVLTSLYDIHYYEYIDVEPVVSGASYDYRMTVVNRNGLESYSNIVTYVVA